MPARTGRTRHLGKRLALEAAPVPVPAGAAPAPGPWRRRLLVLLPALALGLAFGAGLIVRDCSLTCNVGYQLAPLAFLAIALLAVPAVAVQLRLLERVGFETWQVRSAALLALSFVVFRLWTWNAIEAHPYSGPGGAPPSPGEGGLRGDPVLAIQVAYLSFFVWIDPAFVLLFTNLARLVRRVCPGDEEEGVGLMAGGVLAGGMLGGGLSALLVPWWQALGARYEHARDHLLLVVAACLVVYALVARAVARRVPAGAEPPPPAAPQPGLLPLLRGLMTVPALRWTAALLALTGAASIVLEYRFYELVTAQVDASQGRTEWFAAFYLWLNGVSLALLLFGTGRLIRRFGVAFALLTLPLAITAGGAALLLAPVLLVVCALRVAEEALCSSLYEPATELVMMQADPARYDQARTAIGGLAFSLGMGAAALLTLGVTFGLPHAAPRVLSGLLCATGAAWVGAALALRRALARARAPEAPAPGL